MRMLWPILAAAVLVGCKKEANQPGPRPDNLLSPSIASGYVDEAAAITIARRAVATNDSWSDRATYEARRDGTRWLVSAKRIEGYDASGDPKFVWGGDRLIVIETNGTVTRYSRGR